LLTFTYPSAKLTRKSTYSQLQPQTVRYLVIERSKPQSVSLSSVKRKQRKPFVSAAEALGNTPAADVDFDLDFLAD